MKIIAVLLIGVLLAFNTAWADIKFIPKAGKLWVKASGELIILKSEEAKQEYFALQLEDKNMYILSGEFSNALKKLTGKRVGIDGLLRGRVGFGKELVPSIEVKSVKEIAPRGKNE